jgi:predicted DNA-binding WGR domain protein
MIKLYKQERDGVRYWEAWSTSQKVTIHWGELGKEGETREIALGDDDAVEIIEKEAEASRNAGYQTLPNELHEQLIIQYRIIGMGTVDDFDKRTKIEDAMNECLGWGGLGHCDGGDIGSGAMNVFCHVVDAKLSINRVVKALEELGVQKGALIGRQVGDRIERLWPPDANQQFLPL